MDKAGMEPIEQDPRWAQIVTRDPAADGAFYYSVASTGVYCRPSCPSRQADPCQVRFHDSPAACERAGFRACRRCRPTEPSFAERRAAKIAVVCRQIEQAEEPPELAALAAAAGLSPHHLHRVFRAVVGMTPRDYAAAQRGIRVRRLLPQSRTITEAAHEAGFASSGRFYENATSLLGMTPTAYRAGGTGSTIRFALAACSLGTILVACTERGICAILLGDAAAPLLRDLQDRFPAARLLGDDGAFGSLVGQVIALADQPRAAPEAAAALPLDLRGTAFQARVWAALRRIPIGTTVSYAELARRIDAPGSSRAVAAACAANPVALAVPCHRVVRTDGSLSGYRWGIERKRTLLDRERPGPRSSDPD